MVIRSEVSNKLDEFEGTVDKVELEVGIEERKQYHIYIKPSTFEVKGPTGHMSEWVPMSPKSTEESVPQGSVMDRYLTQVEICITEAKKAPTCSAALNLMVGKKFRFKRLKLGKDFDGHAAREYIVPVVRL
jgi:hypothetical protein